MKHNRLLPLLSPLLVVALPAVAYLVWLHYVGFSTGSYCPFFKSEERVFVSVRKSELRAGEPFIALRCAITHKDHAGPNGGKVYYSLSKSVVRYSHFKNQEVAMVLPASVSSILVEPDCADCAYTLQSLPRSIAQLYVLQVTPQRATCFVGEIVDPSGSRLTAKLACRLRINQKSACGSAKGIRYTGAARVFSVAHSEVSIRLGTIPVYIGSQEVVLYRKARKGTFTFDRIPSGYHVDLVITNGEAKIECSNVSRKHLGLQQFVLTE